MASTFNPYVGQAVTICNPRSFQGHIPTYVGRKATVTAVHSHGRAVDLVLEGELDELWFWVDELEPDMIGS